jgi:hypothetical protein
VTPPGAGNMSLAGPAAKQCLMRRNHFGGFVQTSRNGSSVLLSPTTCRDWRAGRK